MARKETKPDELPMVLHLERRARREEDLSPEEIMKVIRKRASKYRKAVDVS